jgi:hypothetical protein
MTPLRPRTLPEHVEDAMKFIEEYTGFNVPKTTAKFTASAYKTAICATAVSMPLAFGGGVVNLSQLPTSPLGDHIVSRTQASYVIQNVFTNVASSTGDRSVKLNGQPIRASGGRLLGAVLEIKV